MRNASGREPHPAKFTTYVTEDELLLLDNTVLELRRRFGIKVDRGRFVREAIATASLRAIADHIREGA